MGDVVRDPDGEAPLRVGALQLREGRRGHRRGELLGREAVTSADHTRHLAGALGQSRDDVLEEGLALCCRILRAIEDGDVRDRSRERRSERVRVERPEEPHLDETDALAVLAEARDGFLRGARSRAHEYEHALGLGMPDVVEEAIWTAG